jgi:predicted phosphodiesterase
MLLGDVHGNTGFMRNKVIPAAKEAGVHWIYQVGDFGYWEHTKSGESYLNELCEELTRHNLELVFIQGNHDKISLLETKYPLVDGFRPVRPGLWFAPNGTQWEIEGKSFIVLGGAYSVDKAYRLEEEEATAKSNAMFSPQRGEYSQNYILQAELQKAAGTLWFPEEEMTDSDMDKILVEMKDTRIDVILAHDKPLAANPMIKLMPIKECEPNQRRLQKAVNTLQPKLFVHGHLHARYTDTIRCGDNDAYTRVEGLGADVPNFNQLRSSWTPQDAWEILDLEG